LFDTLFQEIRQAWNVTYMFTFLGVKQMRGCLVPQYEYGSLAAARAAALRMTHDILYRALRHVHWHIYECVHIFLRSNFLFRANVTLRYNVDWMSVKSTVCHRKSVQSTVCHRTSVKSIVCYRTSVKSIVCYRTSVQSTVCHRTNVKSIVCYRKSVQSTMCHRTSVQSTVCHRTSVQSTVCHRTNFKSTVCHRKSVQSSVSSDEL